MNPSKKTANLCLSTLDWASEHIIITYITYYIIVSLVLFIVGFSFHSILLVIILSNLLTFLFLLIYAGHYRI